MWLVINQLGSPWFYEKFDIFKCPHQGLKINVIYVWPLNRTPARSHRRRFFPSDSASEKSENLGGEGHKELEGLLRTRFYFWFCQNWEGGHAPLWPPFTPALCTAKRPPAPFLTPICLRKLLEINPRSLASQSTKRRPKLVYQYHLNAANSWKSV